MLSIFNKNKPYKNQINISSKFPKKKLIEIFKPYLLLYINSKNLLIPLLKKKAAYELYYKLLNFQNYNPSFGRIQIKHVKKIVNNQIKIIINQEYNDKHILFSNNNNKNFLCDHLSYIQIHYILNINLFYEHDDEEHDDEQEEDNNEQEQEDEEEDNNEEEDVIN